MGDCCENGRGLHLADERGDGINLERVGAEGFQLEAHLSDDVQSGGEAREVGGWELCDFWNEERLRERFVRAIQEPFVGDAFARGNGVDGDEAKVCLNEKIAARRHGENLERLPRFRAHAVS